MKVYIEDRYGNRYNFRRLNRKETSEVLSLVTDKDSATVSAEKQFKEAFRIANPNYNMDLFESEILEYNFEEIGFVNLTKLMTMVLEEVFHTTGTNPSKYSFLEETQK